MNVFRWTLTAPIAVAAWFAIFVIGVFAYEAIEVAACPAGQMISGWCDSDEVQRLLDGVIVFFIALSAIAVVSAVVLIAPTHKVLVAWVVFGIGGLVASYLAIATKMYAGGVAAIASALATALAIGKYLRWKNRSRRPAAFPES